jgi:hypothetical protein
MLLYEDIAILRGESLVLEIRILLGENISYWSCGFELRTTGE